MAQNLFSSTLSPFEGVIENPYLVESIEELKLFLRKNKIDIRIWDEHRIAIPVQLKIELPPLGNINSIDIKPKEQILVVFNLKSYPTVAPVVFTDRLDFPKDQLAHLYIAKNDRPPAFCVVRGNLDEWYSNKRIKDLIIRTRNWLRDAAADELTENGGQFDPLRLEGYRGSIIYNYAELTEVVFSKKSTYNDSNFALCLLENTAGDDHFPSFKLIKFIELTSISEEFQAFVKSLENLIESKSFNAKKYHFGYLIWSKEDKVIDTYYINLPRTWKDFVIFCTLHEIDLSPLENFLSTLDFNFFHEVPIITAINRPKQVIGYSSNIEFVNFYIDLKKEDKKDNKIINNIPVHFQVHNEPLSLMKAKAISGSYPQIDGSIIIGCGALGSKIIMHFIRNGCKSLFIIDNDSISPHNLVRHSLLPEYEGMNKAIALSKVASILFKYDKSVAIVGWPISGESFLSRFSEDLIQQMNWVFDFTASESFLNTLITINNLNKNKVCRAIISDQGDLGILTFEGTNRNPRIDDLLISLHSLYNTDPLIHEWLQREFELNNSGSVLINVGIGCNSETTVLSDEIISSHSAYFAGVIKNFTNKSQDNSKGYIFLSVIENKNEYHTFSKSLQVEPFTILRAINNESWEIRFKSGILKNVKREMGLRMPYETGGVFIGCINHKTKTIHVIDIIYAPADSRTNSVCFYRGINGLPEGVKDINVNSGNQLGYIGEWHTHPFGPNCLSGTDMRTVNRFKREFDTLINPLPVFLLIATPTNILCYVY